MKNKYPVIGDKYRLHHDVEVGTGYTQLRAEGQRIV